MKNKEIKIGQLLVESLTTEQIACILEVVASAGDLQSLMDDFKKVDPDLFVEALADIEENISSYPEWMGAE